jgi:glycosyltransferase involved in cell wall biosynthesis
MLLFWSKSELLYINTAYHISPVIAAKILGKKSLIHVRESPDYFTPTSKYKKIRNYILKNWCDYFICVSEAVAANLRTHFPNAKVVVIHNGVDTSVFNDKTRDEIAIRSEYQIDKENFIVVSAGRMHPDKGPQVLVAALSNLVNKYPQIRGFLLGGPTNTDFFEQKIHSQVDQLKVRTLGYKKNSIDFFAIADVVIHPATYPEPLARTILEAMAMGKCVIATNVGGTSEIIQNGKNGILIPANDVDALSLAVERIVMNSSERERLGKNALQTIQSHFSEKKYVEKIKQFIQQEVYNKPSPI